MSSVQTIRHLLSHCGNLGAKDAVMILSDPNTKALADAFATEARTLTSQVTHQTLASTDRHGEDLPAELQPQLNQSQLIICLCTYSYAHSQARVTAAKHGARFLSMPFYDWALLENPALNVDFHAQRNLTQRFTDALTEANSARVTSDFGTDLYLDLSGRTGNCCPGTVINPGDLGSPPDIEANIAPIESKTSGTLVINGSITTATIGLLSSPVTLTVEAGSIVDFTCKNPETIEALHKLFPTNAPKRRVCAELGIGLNPAAKICGNMLVDEGAYGAIHFGFGSNATIGGQNAVDFHLDFVTTHSSLYIGDQLYINGGQLT